MRQAAMAEVAALKDRMAASEAEEQDLARALDDLLAREPNLPAADVPDGPDESANRVERTVGQRKNFDFAAKQHFEIGEALGLMDFEAAAKISGARFVVLQGRARPAGARARPVHARPAHRASTAIPRSAPPLAGARRGAVRHRPAAEVRRGPVPSPRQDLWLIPTAEVPLTNLVADAIVDEDELPLRFTALTPCFRSEAGAAGKDTRGMIRQHQF